MGFWGYNGLLANLSWHGRAMLVMPPVMSDFHFYEPKNGHGLMHSPFNSIIAPRPIGWISTISADGIGNLAPYSFFNAFNYDPPILGFSSVGMKDSLRNARDTGEFTWSLATRDLAESMNITSAMADTDIDEAQLAGLPMAAAKVVKPPRVAMSPAAMECKVTQIIQLESAAGEKADSWLVLGEVVGVHIDTAMLDDGIYNTARARPIMRGGGPADYFEALAEGKFEMERPDDQFAALDPKSRP